MQTIYENPVWTLVFITDIGIFIEAIVKAWRNK